MELRGSVWMARLPPPEAVVSLPASVGGAGHVVVRRVQLRLELHGEAVARLAVGHLDADGVAVDELLGEVKAAGLDLDLVGRGDALAGAQGDIDPGVGGVLEGRPAHRQAGRRGELGAVLLGVADLALAASRDAHGIDVLPQEGLVHPIYYLFKEMGLYDGKLGCTILVGITYSAFGTYLLSSVFSSFPRELIEAASLDGAGRWTILWRIVLPMSWPTLSVMCVFFFVWSWNEFLHPLVLLISNDNQTVPLGLSVLQGQYSSDPTSLSAAALLGFIPMVVFFLIFQRSLTRGLTAGAVK
jgi:hypothetical protein